MSTAVADATEVTEPPPAPKRNWKKLLIFGVAALVLLAVIGTGAALFIKKKRAAAAQADEGETAEAAAHVEEKTKHDAKHAPTFVPLDTFTVNLADKEAERYAQIGLTFELDDPKVVDDIRAYMPAIRNNILMVLAHKSSAELLAREGKEKLAYEVKREASRALGIRIEEQLVVVPVGGASGAARKTIRRPAEPSPIRQVHFSNFIIQ